MAKHGWLTIRNVPDIPATDGNAYFEKLIRFFKKNDLCPKCKGKGSKQKKEMEMRGETTVRFGGIEQLEKLNKMEDVSMTDIIRDILSRQCLGKRPCTLCLGTRFVNRDVATEYNKKKKAKGKKRVKGKAKGKKAH